ncbi:unnamed protein product, partial [Brassica rapa subsp. narinosa]
MKAICYILLDQSLNLPGTEGRDGTDEGSMDGLTVNDKSFTSLQTQSVNHQYNQFQSTTLILRERSNKK